MELLKERIRRDGRVKGTDVLKVDSFLNHQMDVELFAEIGKEFKRRFADCEINKILTIEASGIGIACVAAQYFHCPVIFAKKSQTKNIAGEVYTSKVESFTHGRVYDIVVAKEFLGAGDKVLVLKAGVERESPYILGKIQENVEEAGPIRLFGPGSALGLDQGRVELEGTVYLNGQTLEAYIQKIVAEMLG